MNLADLFSEPAADSAAQTRTRLLGSIAAFLGLQIVVGMAMLTWFTLPIILGTRAENGGAGFTGGPLDRWLVLLIYALAALIGLIIVLAGAVQAMTGQRARPLVVRLIMLVASLAMLAGMGLGL